MKVYTALLLLFVACSVVCKSRADHSPNCASMRGWYPGIEPKPVTDNTPYKLVVSSSRDHYKTGLYGSGERLNVTLMRNATTGGNGTFVGFIIYAKIQFPDDVSSVGNFVKPLPAGVEVDECHDGYMFEVAKNSTSQNRTSVHLGWMTPANNPAGKITFSASVAEAGNVYYEGFEFVLKYYCPVPGCNIPGGCPNGLARNKNECIICECASGAGSIGVAFSSFLAVVLVLVYHLL